MDINELDKNLRRLALVSAFAWLNHESQDGGVVSPAHNNPYLAIENISSEKIIPKDTINQAYTQRAIAIVLFAKMAQRLGYKVGIGLDNNEHWEPQWRNVLYVEIPEGQFSWHFHPNDFHLIENFPLFNGEWDGKFNGRNIELVKSI